MSVVIKASLLAVAALLASGFALLGCTYSATQIHESSKQFRENLNGLIGHEEAEVIALLGEPSGTDSDGKDGVVLIWDEGNDGWLFPALNPTVAGVPLHTPSFRGGDYARSVMVYVHADGTIYGWNIQKS